MNIRASFAASRETAYHESGHCVVGIVRGLHLRYVEIDHGLTWPFRGTTSFATDYWPLGDVVIMLLSGAESERRGFGMIRDGVDDVDLQMAREALSRAFTVSPSDPMIDTALIHLREAAADDVREHWDLIMKVATALRQRRVLDAKAIEGLGVRAVLPAATQNNERISI